MSKKKKIKKLKNRINSLKLYGDHQKKKYDDILKQIQDYVRDPESDKSKDFKTWVILSTPFPFPSQFFISSMMDSLSRSNNENSVFAWNILDQSIKEEPLSKELETSIDN